MKLLKENRKWRRAEISFWLFSDREILEHLFGLMKDGQFGRIRHAEGHSQDRLGRPVSFTYDAGNWEFAWPDPKGRAAAGKMLIEGDFTNEDLLNMRNHTAFHLRGFFKEKRKS